MNNINTPVIERNIFGKIAAHLDNPEITLIIGPRQVGKTVIMGQMQEYLKTNHLYIILHYYIFY